MGALDKIRAHAAAPAERPFVDVPEWDALRIFYRKTTLNDVALALKLAPDNPVRQNVEMFVSVAEETNGEAMFRRIDVLELMEKADPNVLSRVMGEMGIVRASAEEIEKN